MNPLHLLPATVAFPTRIVLLCLLLMGCPTQHHQVAIPVVDANARSCGSNVVLMGYWPPTNEMLRPWSTNTQQNPAGWIGARWQGHGFDVRAFFPEFPPDADPTNDAIGEPGSVGTGDLTVDYQDTSADFWRIVEQYRPRVLITTSRGGAIGWELERFEGGHDGGADPSLDWASDRAGITHPTRASIDPRSWDAIETYRAGNRLTSTLPLQAIHAATTAQKLVDVVIEDSTSGNYLSGFLGLHGLYYQSITPRVEYAGHIHVGRNVSPEHAHALMGVTLDVVLSRLARDPDCASDSS